MSDQKDNENETIYITRSSVIILVSIVFAIAYFSGFATGYFIATRGDSRRYQDIERTIDERESTARELIERTEDANRGIIEYTERLSESIQRTSDGLQEQSTSIGEAQRLLEELRTEVENLQNSVNNNGDGPGGGIDNGNSSLGGNQ